MSAGGFLPPGFGDAAAPWKHGRAGGAETVVVLGATSAIGRAVAAEFAARGHALVLAARDAEEAEATAADLRLRHAVDAVAVRLEVLDFGRHAEVAAACVAAAGEDRLGVVLCVGYLGSHEEAQRDPAELRRVLDTNFTACVCLLERFAEALEGRGGGWICAVSSVAGDRGRQSNYLYGAAKGGLSVYLQGLRNRLFRAGVAVVEVKPGFVDSRMTFGKAGLFAVASPERVARGVLQAVVRKRNTVYLPGFWRPLMAAIRAIPEPLFKRMRL